MKVSRARNFDNKNRVKFFAQERCGWSRHPGETNAEDKRDARKPSLLHHQIVPGSHLAIGTGGVDFHLFRGELVKKIWRAPSVAHFAVGIDTGSRRNRKPELLRIAAGECLRDLGVGSHRILSKHGAEVAETDLKIFDFRLHFLHRHRRRLRFGARRNVRCRFRAGCRRYLGGRDSRDAWNRRSGNVPGRRNRRWTRGCASCLNWLHVLWLRRCLGRRAEEPSRSKHEKHENQPNHQRRLFHVEIPAVQLPVQVRGWSISAHTMNPKSGEPKRPIFGKIVAMLLLLTPNHFASVALYSSTLTFGIHRPVPTSSGLPDARTGKVP